MNIAEQQEKIIKEFEPFNSLIEKYIYLVKLGKNFSLNNNTVRSEEALIRGCQLTTWFSASFKQEKMFYDIDSSSLIIKGAASLLERIFSGHTPEEIRDADLFFVEKIGLQDLFSPIRANSLWKIENKIRQEAGLFMVKI